MDKFATTFDDNSTGFGGFDDGFGGGFSKANNDPFAKSTGAHDPFGDKKNTDSSSQDVSWQTANITILSVFTQ